MIDAIEDVTSFYDKSELMIFKIITILNFLKCSRLFHTLFLSKITNAILNFIEFFLERFINKNILISLTEE